ncbi:MFS transporter [Acuticoccus sp. I52.16.1]|uniref:MFS transporter n=1 Tax=Acuticoccus sp. I52.16.1 TaxID=2928472 RepID=UPI001FD29D5A|nr:MFS transporter [Acuticoccus sp. I52.16.1]UOM37228.1 MFS transporter [Acuticoccus sp. I52.16.1]
MGDVTAAAARPKPWIAALVVATAMQTVLAMLTRALPVIGPPITALAGVPDENVGHLAALCSFGTMVFLLGGAPLIAVFGPVRLLQCGALLGGGAILLGLSGSWAALLLASFAIGVGYAPSAPAGSEVLQQRVPARRRSLMFSIKQSGVPLGGVIAGAMLPPLLLWGGVPAAIVGAAVLTFLAVLAAEPLRHAIDADRPLPPEAAAGALAPRLAAQLTMPFRIVLADPGRIVITFAGVSFAVAQGALFTFFVTALHVGTDHSLAAIGAAFALMQAVGVVSRVAVGWIADRIGSAHRTLVGLAFASSATMAVLAFAEADWPYVAISAVAAVSGFAVASWNGVLLAEVSALAPRGRVGEATAATTFFIFAGYVIGPLVISTIVAATGSYTAGFLFAAAPPFVSGLLLLAIRHRAPPTPRAGA